MLFATGTKGGVWHKKAWGCGSPTFLKLFLFTVVCRCYSDSRMTIQKKFGETIATPPETGGACGPV